MSIEEIKSTKKLKEMLRLEIMDNKYLKECCEKAGIELAKNSFEWDGKPKNLVVYALELNTIIDQLKAENEELKRQRQADKGLITLTGKMNYQLLQEYDKLKTENDELKKCYKNNSALLDFEETNTTKLVNKVMKLEKTLTEIKEIAQQYEDTPNLECKQLCCTEILQKISECEENDG